MTALDGHGPTTDIEHDDLARAIPSLRSIWAGVFMRSELPSSLPRPTALVIILLDSPGSHWVGIWIPARGPADWLDPYGLPPPRDLENRLRSMFGGLRYEDIGRQPLRAVTCGQRSVLALARASQGNTRPLPQSDRAIMETLKKLVA